jgi:lysozyme
LGYGHTSGVKEGDTCTKEEALHFLEDDIREAEIGARSLLSNFLKLSPRRQDAMVNLVFNMGRSRLSYFHDFLRAMRSECWKVAAHELEWTGDKKTPWFKTVGSRAHNVINMILEG